METVHERQGDHGLSALAGSCMYLLFPILHTPRRDERSSQHSGFSGAICLIRVIVSSGIRDMRGDRADWVFQKR
ncbi:MAG: hypothetical protein NVSMB22_27050 [Chloroflexota bacterium]